MTDYCFRRVRAVSQESFFFGKWQVYEIFFENKIFCKFFVNKRRTNIFFQKSSPGSLDNTFFI